jgi:hypothetical protein
MMPRRRIYEMLCVAKTPRQRIYKMLCIAHSDDRKFPATIFYNEGWLLRLVLDWFSRQPVVGHPLDFSSGARWFSEALLPSQFLPRVRGDRLAEGWTHADGIIGHITIGNGALANAALAKDASQFIVTEAKLFAPLSPGVTNARDFDQAARNVACIAEMLCRAERRPERLSSLGFFVLAPAERIDARNLFNPLLSKESINEKVTRRVSQYAGSPEGQRKAQWFRNWFTPALEHIKVSAISWEEIIKAIRGKDACFGARLSSFYDECRQFNRIQEPEMAPRVQ